MTDNPLFTHPINPSIDGVSEEKTNPIGGGAATDAEKMTAHYRMDMEFVESKLNHLLYVSWYRKYISYMFWGNIGTLLNLSITLLSALIASSPNTGSFLSDSVITTVKIVIVILSTINTYFRPYIQANNNMKFMGEIQKYGAQFDAIYYTPKLLFREKDYMDAREKYKEVLFEYNKYASENSIEQKNVCIDLLYGLLVNTFLRRTEEEKEWVRISYV